MRVRIYLGHGASGSAATMAPFVAGLRARGLDAHAVDLPKRRAEDAIGRFLEQVPDEAGVIVGGHSFGGRVASLIAAGIGPSALRVHRPIGLVCFSYPLHRPGHPDQLRIDHWPAIRCPVLLLSGESDPFARIDPLRTSVGLLRDAELVTFAGVGHGVRPVLDVALDRVAAFANALA